MIRSLTTLLLTCASLLPIACGGGGGSDPNPSPTPLGANTAAYAHQALPANSVGSLTTCDHALLNGNPNAYVLVTPALETSGFVYMNHAISVQYIGAQWYITFPDLTDVPSGAVFNVTVSDGPVAGATAFGLHVATAANIDSIRTFIDHPAANGNPSAVIIITNNASPGGALGSGHAHPTGLVFDNLRGRWAIYNRDSAPMPEGTAFNYAVVATGPDSPFSEAVVHQSTAASITGGTTYPGLSANGTAIVHATPVYVDGVSIAYTRHFGVFYDGTRGWGLFNQNATPVVADTVVNLAVAPR